MYVCNIIVNDQLARSASPIQLAFAASKQFRSHFHFRAKGCTYQPFLGLAHAYLASTGVPQYGCVGTLSTNRHDCSQQQQQQQELQQYHRKFGQLSNSLDSTFIQQETQQGQPLQQLHTSCLVTQPCQHQQNVRTEQQHQAQPSPLLSHVVKFFGSLAVFMAMSLAERGRGQVACAATLPPLCTDTATRSNTSATSRRSSSSSDNFNSSEILYHQRTSRSSSSRGQSSLTSPMQSSKLDALQDICMGVDAPRQQNSGTSRSCSAQPLFSTAAAPAPAVSTAAARATEAAFPTTNSSSSGSNTATQQQPPLPPESFNDLLAYEQAAVMLFQRVKPSVVNITHMRAMPHFYTLDIHRMAVGQGSGFLWDKAGHVVTNYHVIKGAAEVKVTLFDHSTCTARVVGFDVAKDIAVLKLALPRGRLDLLQPVTLGSSSSLRVGQACFAIGNPFGLDHTLTQGIVSGLGRELSTGLSSIKNVIQTDAAINPGNSGGVLLNSAGKVIGVNIGILDPGGKGSFSGVGFAIPVDTVKGIVDQILMHGRVRRPTLGIAIAPSQVLEQLGVEGVLILEVPAGSPAAAAGLRPTYRDVFGDIVMGDIIVGIDTRPVRSFSDLIAALDERRPGDKVRCDVLREGKRLSVTATLGERGASCE